MSINLRVLLVLGFLESGNSNSDVSISQTWVGEGRDITCILRGNENISQINWEIQQGRNRTILGIDNPDHGIHIMPEYKAQVELQGHLEKCMEIREEVTSINMSVIKGFTGVPEQKMGFFGHLGVIVIGTIGSLFILTFLFYICQKHNCARRKSFKIRTFQTQSTAEIFPEPVVDPQSDPSSTNGFDPSKLYAKIKNDIFYGRLWKSYQGQPKVWTQGTMMEQGHIYHLLGQSPLPQRSVEARAMRRDSTL